MALFSEPVIRAAGRHAAKRISLTAAQQLRQLERTSPDRTFDIFLSHSYMDAELVLGLRETINGMGFSVYVDWVDDDHLQRSDVSRETAVALRQRMANSEALFYATSIASPASKWMPWECGYFDGLKGRVAICPLTQSAQDDNQYAGQEYLGLYPYVAQWCRQQDSDPTLWIHETSSKYVNFTWWLKGGVPHEPHVSC